MLVLEGKNTLAMCAMLLPPMFWIKTVAAMLLCVKAFFQFTQTIDP